MKTLFTLSLSLLSIIGFTQQNFDFVFTFSEGYAPFLKDDKFGFINEDGEVVIEPNYHLVEHFKNGLAKVKMHNKWGLINTKDEFVAYCKYDQIGDLSERLIFVKIDYHFGFINHQGEEIFPVNFWDKDWENIHIKNNVILANDNEKYGLVNVNKDTIIQFDYEYMVFMDDNYIRCVKEEGGLKGILDVTGKVIIPFEYEYILDDNSFQEGLIAARLKSTKKYGYLNERNEVIIDFKYDYAESFSNGLAFVRDGEYFGVIDRNDELILPFIYEQTMIAKDGSSLTIGFENNRAIVELDNSISIIDKKGNIIIKSNYDDAIQIPGHNLVAVIKDDLMGIISSVDGSIVIPLEFDKLYPLNEDRIFVVKNQKIGCYNVKGKMLFKPKYDVVEEMDFYYLNKYAIISKNGKFGFINKKGKEITPITFDGCQYFKDGIAPVKQNNKAFYINRRNKCKLLCD